MKKHIIILAILAIEILILPFLLGDKISLLAEQTIETTAPTATPEPTIETDIIEIVIPTPSNTVAPEQSASPTPGDWPEFPIIDEPVIETPAPHSPSAPTAVPQVSVPHGAAFVLTIHGKNITIAPSVDEATLEKTPGWLNTSASPGEEGVCVVYGHRNRNHLQILKEVTYGETITVTMPDGSVYTYMIESIEIFESNEDLRIPTIEGKHMMLTTCYPFYYTGHAPKKLIVLAKVT
jgi:LPXTG-site transpeptidase (sortase) family protein